MIEIDKKDVFKMIRPYPLVFVMTIDGEGKPTGMACGWHMKCSLNPPLYAVALKKGKYTHEMIKNSKEFVVAFPSHELEKEIEYFGTRSGKEFDKFKKTDIKTRESTYLRVPLVEKASINMECFLQDTFETSDHTVFVGKVVSAHYKPGQKLLFYLGQKEGVREFKEL